MSKVLVLGATGATGSLVVQQLLGFGIVVSAIIRDASAMGDLKLHLNLELTIGDISDMTPEKLLVHIDGCDAVFSCLGHRLTLGGVFGEPRQLVTQTMRNISESVLKMNSKKTVRLILMNTTGNANRDIDEGTPLSQRLVVGILRVILPPHKDNEMASDVLRLDVGQGNPKLEWVVVRPDQLVDEKEVSNYDIFDSPQRNAIFDSGKTSRINVANFMAKLFIDDETWVKWKGKMPVIYNR
jgi:putative NADH-flavin reductase